jgi:syntaxin 6
VSNDMEACVCVMCNVNVHGCKLVHTCPIQFLLSLTLSLSLSYLQDTAVNTHALKDAKKQLKRHIRNAESTLKDVQTTISLIETQKDRFAHIDASELYERKALVTTSNDRLGRVKSDMNSDVIKQKILADERAKAQRRMKRDDDEEHDIENTAFIADSQAHTSLLLQQQDETLDELGEAVTRVGQMAENIHQEIGYQNKMLTDMEDDLADAEEKLGLVMGKLAKFLKTKDKWQLGTILMLTLVALILFCLVLTT